MLKNRLRKPIGLLLIIVIFVGCYAPIVRANPYARASSLIQAYSTTATASSGGKITIATYALASASMSTLGYSSCKIYKQSGTSWTLVSTLSGSTGSNTSKHTGSRSYTGTAGATYKATVVYYAKSASGTTETISSTSNSVVAK